jgi:hypothetical protein
VPKRPSPDRRPRQEDRPVPRQPGRRGDPTVIGPWIAETQAQKVTARAEIRSATGQRRMTRDEIAAIVTALGDLVQVIHDANPADKADLYAQLGLTLACRPQKRLVEASVIPSLHMCKGFVSEGGLEHGFR